MKLTANASAIKTNAIKSVLLLKRQLKVAKPNKIKTQLQRLKNLVKPLTFSGWKIKNGFFRWSHKKIPKNKTIRLKMNNKIETNTVKTPLRKVKRAVDSYHPSKAYTLENPLIPL